MKILVQANAIEERNKQTNPKDFNFRAFCGCFESSDIMAAKGLRGLPGSGRSMRIYILTYSRCKRETLWRVCVSNRGEALISASAVPRFGTQKRDDERISEI